MTTASPLARLRGPRGTGRLRKRDPSLFDLASVRGHVAIQRKIGQRFTVRTLLLDLADRFGEEARPGVAIGLRLTHQRLAEMIACTREAVSKEMAFLEREGHIETRNRERRIVLLDREKFSELAG